jgi:hypothetical protein
MQVYGVHVRWFFQLLHPPGRLCWRSHMNIRAHTHTPTLSLTHTYNHSLTHTRTRTHTHIHTHTHTHTQETVAVGVLAASPLYHAIGLCSTILTAPATCTLASSWPWVWLATWPSCRGQTFTGEADSRDVCVCACACACAYVCACACVSGPVAHLRGAHYSSCLCFFLH